MPVRVLLVDDVDAVRVVVRTALRLRGGFEVVGEAASGAEAIGLAERDRPDVVVLDLGLPDLAGRELLGRLRGVAPTSRFVVFSGTDTDRAWFEEHVEGYVLKQRDASYLVDLLVSVTSRPPIREQLTAEYAIDLEQDLTAVARARGFVREILRAASADGLYDDAALVVSELVTNAITHAGSACQLRVSLTPSVLRLAVTDTSAGMPEPQAHDETSEHGRGLHLVGAVASAWGIDTSAEGKVVWAELPRVSAVR